MSAALYRYPEKGRACTRRRLSAERIVLPAREKKTAQGSPLPRQDSFRSQKPSLAAADEKQGADSKAAPDKKTAAEKIPQPVTYRPGHFLRLILAEDKFDQKPYGADGACGTLANLYLMQRMRGMRPRAILNWLRKPPMIEAVIASHTRASWECCGVPLQAW